MKQPQYPIVRLKLKRGLYTPHREKRRAETDITPIHKQCFPLKHRLQSPLVYRPPVHLLDPVPIHMELFPVLHENSRGKSASPSAIDDPYIEEQALQDIDENGVPSEPEPLDLSVADSRNNRSPSPPSIDEFYIPETIPQRNDRNGVTSETEAGITTHPDDDMPSAAMTTDHLRVTPPLSNLLAPGYHLQTSVTRTNDRPAEPSAKVERTPELDGTPLRKLICSRRREKKIRGLEVLMGWFEAKSGAELKEPCLCDDARPNDVFVHSFGRDGQQIWLLGETGVWIKVNGAREHPNIPTHRLVISEGRPSWVTRKTIATYGYRKKADLSATVMRSV